MASGGEGNKVTAAPGKNLKGGILLAGGSVTVALCSFLRNIIIARLISVEDFGISATFAITVTLLEMSSNLAVDRLLVQAPDGDDPRLQAAAQAFQVALGALGAIILFFAADPIAALFGVPQATWAFRALALVPMIRGLSHLDMARVQREMRFGPSVWVEAGPQVLVTLLAVPLGVYLGDYRAMLWVVLIQSASYTLFSHLVAHRPYSLAVDKALARRIVGFGWPLLLNGFLMFGIFQGDRAIVGAAFDMDHLGWFSAAFAITLAPTVVVAKVCYNFFLPQLSPLQGDAELFHRRSMVVIQICLLAGVAVAVGFATAGPAMLTLLYGERYGAGVAVISLLGLMQGVRVARVGATIVAIAKGETRIPLYVNIVRTLGLALSILAVWFGFGIYGVVISALIGEALAVIASLMLVRWKLNVRVVENPWPWLVALVVTSGTYLLAGEFTAMGNPWLEIPAGIVITLAVCGFCLLTMPETRMWLRRKDS